MKWLLKYNTNKRNSLNKPCGIQTISWNPHVHVYMCHTTSTSLMLGGVGGEIGYKYFLVLLLFNLCWGTLSSCKVLLFKYDKRGGSCGGVQGTLVYVMHNNICLCMFFCGLVLAPAINLHLHNRDLEGCLVSVARFTGHYVILLRLFKLLCLVCFPF